VLEEKRGEERRGDGESTDEVDEPTFMSDQARPGRSRARRIAKGSAERLGPRAASAA
jgi:hypothetical protein